MDGMKCLNETFRYPMFVTPRVTFLRSSHKFAQSNCRQNSFPECATYLSIFVYEVHRWEELVQICA